MVMTDESDFVKMRLESNIPGLMVASFYIGEKDAEGEGAFLGRDQAFAWHFRVLARRARLITMDWLKGPIELYAEDQLTDTHTDEALTVATFLTLWHRLQPGPTPWHTLTRDYAELVGVYSEGVTG